MKVPNQFLRFESCGKILTILKLIILRIYDSSDEEEDDNYGNMSLQMLREKLVSMDLDLDGTKNKLID